VIKATLTSRILDYIHETLTKISSADHLTLTICVVTKPEEGATFSFSPSSEQSTEEQLIFSTDGLYPNVWIGRYRYKIVKTGYEEVEGLFDFIDMSSSTLECPLVKKGEGGPIACRLANAEIKTKCHQMQ
jgi:hypothetical protein